MRGNTDLVKLYSGKILALAADVPHLARLTTPDATVKRRSPVCGSMVTVDVVLEGGRVVQFGQDVKACAHGQAAAAVTGEAILGRTPAELALARDELRQMLKDAGPTPSDPFAGFEVLAPARDFKNRHASILLSIEAAAEAAEMAQDKSNCA